MHQNIPTFLIKRLQHQEWQRRQQAAGAGAGAGSSSSATTDSFYLQPIQSNPQLQKWLVLAKRQKVKQDFLLAQEALTQQLVTALQQQQEPDDCCSCLCPCCGLLLAATIVSSKQHQQRLVHYVHYVHQLSSQRCCCINQLLHCQMQ